MGVEEEDGEESEDILAYFILRSSQWRSFVGPELQI